MGIGLVADEGVVFVEREDTEAVYKAEQASESAVESLSDGLEFTPTKELLTRSNRTATVETVKSLLGTKSMTGSVPVELKASGGVEGSEPETGVLWEALLGGKRQGVAVVSKTGHTSTRIEIEDADIGNYKVGDTVKVKEAGAHHISPITVVDTTALAAYIELLVPFTGPFSDNVEIGGFTTYFHQSNAPTLSITNYLGGEIREKAIGMRPVSCELGNYSTGALADTNFSVEGTSFDREVGQPLFTPSFDSDNGVTPPVTLCAKVYQDDQEIQINTFGLSLTNTLAFLTSTASKNGKIASRITKFEVTGNINPYMEDDDVDTFDLFESNDSFSLFTATHNDDAVDGEFKEGIAFYVPNASISELATGVEDGVLTDAVAFTGAKTLGNDAFFISFH